MTNNNRPVIGLARQPAASQLERATHNRTEAPQAVTVDDRIAQLRAEIDALVSAKVDSIAASCPGIPLGVLRNMLIGNNAGCQCSQYLALANQ